MPCRRGPASQNLAGAVAVGRAGNASGFGPTRMEVLQAPVDIGVGPDRHTAAARNGRRDIAAARAGRRRIESATRSRPWARTRSASGCTPSQSQPLTIEISAS